LKYFGEEAEIVECRTFRNVCDLLDRDQVDCAVMAIENSIAGSLLQNYALIRDYHLKIVGEIYIHIQMNLMVFPGVKKKEIKEIYSHPVSFLQCAEYLERHFPNAERKELGDNALVAKLIHDEKILHAAAISNLRSASLYGLEILDKGIETNKKNYTRFWILSKHVTQNERNNKASLCFEVGHYYGALARVLNIFAENKINLNKIQSVPVLGKPNEYTMHVDVEWDSEGDYERAIHQILKNVSSLAVLGEYKKADINS